MRTRTRARPLARPTRAPGVAAVVLVAAGCLVVAREARHLTFSGDDWSFVLDRRGFDADVFLQPHGEHLSALPVLAYKTLLEVFGADSYAPFMGLALLVHGIACVLLYVLARRYVGPWAALAPAAVLVVLGPAWHDLLWAFQVTYFGSVAAGLGMVLCLARRDRPGDVAAAVLLGASLLCSSIGLGFVVFATVLLGLERPPEWRRLWVVGAPLGLYLAWYVAYGESSVDVANADRLPAYLATALSAAMASVSGLAQTEAEVSPYLVSTTYGRFVAVAAVAALILHVARGGTAPPVAWAAAAAAVTLWTAACLSFIPGGREAEQSRYQYAAAVFVLLAGGAIAQGWRPSRRGGAVLAIATLLVCVANVRMLHQRSAFWTENSAYIAAETGVMEVARDTIAPDFVPEDYYRAAVIGVHNLQPISAGPYLSAVDAFGSAADTPRDILNRPEDVRQAADLVLAQAERLNVRPSEGLPSRALCRSTRAGKDVGEITVGPGTLAVRVRPGAPAKLRLRRFGSYRFLRYELKGGRTSAMRLPRDRSRLPWRAHPVGGEGLRVCVAPGSGG
jgi:hypothetical protein